MHWLKEFRLNYVQKDGTKGISREQLAAMIKLKHGKCSALLIGIVEGGGITHPNIANQIAIIAGATAAQRNSMVHKNYRGGWEPPKRRPEHKNPPKPLVPDVIPDHARRVVAIDIAGNEIGRYESLRAAADAAGCTQAAVSNRCHRRRVIASEFSSYSCTWRFEEEWDAMSELARAADIENAQRDQRRKKNAQQHDHGQVPEACPANQPG